MLPRLACLLLLLASPAVGLTLTVTTGADVLDGGCDAHCSLREAVMLANALPGPDRIALPAGTVTLAIAGANENRTLSGDLDVTGDLVIAGAGARRTVIDARRIDRILHGIDAVVTLEDLGLRRGRVRADNGGCVLVDEGALVLRRVSVEACGTDGWGGGLHAVEADVTVIDSTLADNHAGRGGGLYYQGRTRHLRIENATISGNRAAAGGGLFVDEECGRTTACAITASTIAANHGGGLQSAAGAFSLTLDGVLLADNVGGNCAPGSARSLGYNLDDDGTCPLTRGSDRPRADPRLLALRATGGPTDTHALDAGSAAIDGGDPVTCPAVDQRGQARLGGCDVGAHEATLGTCGDGVLDRGEDCDSGDPCCVGCAAAGDGRLCADDGNPCSNDVCTAGECRHPAALRSNCRLAARDALSLTAAGELSWEWARGAPTAAADFGLPAGTSALCVYDGSDHELLAGRSVAAGGDWRAAGAGFRHLGSDLRAALQPGRAARARIAAQAGGAVLPLDVGPPLRVEWRAPGGQCWASDFTGADIVRADAQRLVARR